MAAGNFSRAKTKQNRSFEDKQSALVQEIWEDFKQLNEDISFTYRLIQEEPTNEQFQVKLRNLRERRITLSRELYLAKNSMLNTRSKRIRLINKRFLHVNVRSVLFRVVNR